MVDVHAHKQTCERRYDVRRTRWISKLSGHELAFISFYFRVRVAVRVVLDC